MRVPRTLLLAALVPLLPSCTGYTLGGHKPTKLAHIESIAVPTFQNQTMFPRVNALATNTTVDAMVRDGTYKMGKVGTTDAVLLGKVESINYRQIRANRLDTNRPEELENTVSLTWKLVDGKQRVLDQGRASGTSRFFVGDNLQTARNNALPDALQRASTQLVSRLADGF